jgi:hypothetical protein
LALMKASFADRGSSGLGLSSEARSASQNLKKPINCTSVWLNCTVIDTDIDQANGSINGYIAHKETCNNDQKNISLDWPCLPNGLRYNLILCYLLFSFKCALPKRGFESELSGYLIFPATLLWRRQHPNFAVF